MDYLLNLTIIQGIPGLKSDFTHPVFVVYHINDYDYISIKHKSRCTHKEGSGQWEYYTMAHRFVILLSICTYARDCSSVHPGAYLRMHSGNDSPAM